MMPLYIEGMEIRRAMLDLVTPTKSADKAMRKLGIELMASRRSLIEQHRCFPRGLHLDKDPLEVKAWQAAVASLVPGRVGARRAARSR